MLCVFNRPGSVLTDFSIETTSDNLNLVSANQQLASSLRSLGFNVSETAFSQSGRCLRNIYIFFVIDVTYVYNYSELLTNKTEQYDF